MYIHFNRGDTKFKNVYTFSVKGRGPNLGILNEYLYQEKPG